jgi:Zn-dependent M16 (insulinase) family peptidase
MTATHGFELIREQKLSEINSTAQYYRHVATGAELISLLTKDENKVFGVNFGTPPADSTGVAHILEHSVLSGSQKYPVKELFFELSKRTRHTFLNAMTYPDKTCYPVASQDIQDFYNLVDVYLDAVFHPRLTPETFQQEGWHYELDAPDAPLVYKGVVFNEMKGNYSSPDRMLGEVSQQSLYPDITYGLDSGGDPRRIPDLTFEQFKDFHARHYHPSNAKAFFYGDDDPEERLRVLDRCFSQFSRIDVDSEVRLQPRFSAPKRLTCTYAAGAPEEEGEAGAAGQKEAMISVNWMIDEIADIETALGVDILNYILIGTGAAPLHKALIDSGLGEGLAGGGLEDNLRQPMFSIGLKGIDPADAGKTEQLIADTLAGLADHGIDPLTVEAALNIIEFNLRESNMGSMPRGIVYMLHSLRSWLHGRDPLAPLAFAEPLAAIRQRVASGERYFENLLRRLFIDNPHRTVVVLTPDHEQAEREAKEEAAHLAQVRAGMSDQDIKAVVAKTRLLKDLQERPDSPEALATIPTVKLSDLPRENKSIPLEVTNLSDARVLYHDLPTSGIVYLDLGFDLHTLPADLLPYMPLFSRSLVETGVGNEDFVRLSQRIGRSTGGISRRRWASTRVDGTGATAWLNLRGKALPDQTGDLLTILRDILEHARLDNRDRIKQLVLEAKASLESQIVPAGSVFVARRLRAAFHEADWANEQMDGLTYLFFLRKLADDVTNNWDAVHTALERIRSLLVNRAAMVCNVTAEGAVWEPLKQQLADFLGALPLAPATAAPWRIADTPRAEGFVVPTKVNYVAKAINLYQEGVKPSGAHLVAEAYIHHNWLLNKIRVQGGAYGGNCSFNRHSGDFTFASYRDPNLLATLDVYDRTAEFLRTSPDLDEEELERHIIGTIGNIDTYQLPDAKGFVSMQRYLIGDTDASRQKMRDEVLATTVADVRRFGDALAQVAAKGRIAVIGSEQAIDDANKERPGLLTVSRVM